VRFCAPCHGDRGDGAGALAAELSPPPRDFTRGVYKFRSTESGTLPSRADLRRTIDEGLPGTAMPGWRAILPEADREALVDVVIGLSPRFKREGHGPIAAISPEPGADPGSIARGRDVYARRKCAECHGPEGKGDGPSTPTLKDDLGRPIPTPDLTRARTLRHSATAIDIARTFITGLDGTPMPSYRDTLTPAELWDLARYLKSRARTPDWWERELLMPLATWFMPAD
jgi:mono/diheme cytochrome c family protein